MSAKEMFRELGYRLVEKNDYSVRYEGRKNKTETQEYYIEIWKRNEMDDYLVRKATIRKEYVCNLWGNELQAINKQIEELGWIE